MPKKVSQKVEPLSISVSPLQLGLLKTIATI
jgi:hypothetical protein